MRRPLPFIAAIIIISTYGYAKSRHLANRGDGQALSDAVARLNQVPVDIGVWQGQVKQLDSHQLAGGKIAGHLLRDYVNRESGEFISLVIVCGRPGPISVHTPDICYTASGFAMTAAPAHYTLPLQPPVEFFVGDFQDQSPVPKPGLRIFWAWNAGKGWQAPEHPRLMFASGSFLYKVYVIRETRGINPPVENDPTIQFLEAVLPTIERVLTPTSSPPAKVAPESASGPDRA